MDIQKMTELLLGKIEEMKADINATIQTGHAEMKAQINAKAQKSKSDPDVLEAAVGTYNEISDEMETSGTTEAVLERQGLRKEEMNVDVVGSVEERRVKVRHRRQPRKRIQDSVGSRQKLTAARRQKIRRSGPAVRKGHA
jgi:hypothetical protein